MATQNNHTQSIIFKVSEAVGASLLEEKVVAFILAKAKITEKKIESDKLPKLPEEMD